MLPTFEVFSFVLRCYIYFPANTFNLLNVLWLIIVMFMKV